MITIKSKRRDISGKAVLFLSLIFLSSTALAGSDDEGLVKQATHLFGPLPSVMNVERNPVTTQKVRLGKMLFYETRISVDGTVSCAKCHPIGLYGADGLKKAIGDNCKLNPRNAPTVFNAAFEVSAHWIGNRKDVEDQAKQSVIGPPSYGMPSYGAVEEKLKEFAEYRALFKEAFPADKDPVTIDNFAKAIGAFERTLVTPSPFDAFLKGNSDALTAQQKSGLKTFIETGCAGCHSGTLVGGQTYQKFGIFEPYMKYTKSETTDEGRYAVTKNEQDRYVFKVPLLRNVTKTPPYFHDGSVDRLEDAIWIMGKVQLGRDLEKQHVEDVRAFLNSLTGKIPEDALKIPLLPSQE